MVLVLFGPDICCTSPFFSNHREWEMMGTDCRGEQRDDQQLSGWKVSIRSTWMCRQSLWSPTKLLIKLRSNFPSYAVPFWIPSILQSERIFKQNCYIATLFHIQINYTAIYHDYILISKESNLVWNECEYLKVEVKNKCDLFMFLKTCYVWITN